MLNRAVGPLGELANRARSPAIPVAGHLDYRVGRDALRDTHRRNPGRPHSHNTRAVRVSVPVGSPWCYPPLRLG